MTTCRCIRSPTSKKLPRGSRTTAPAGRNPSVSTRGMTALAFAQFLGYTDIDQIVTSRGRRAGRARLGRVSEPGQREPHAPPRSSTSSATELDPTSRGRSSAPTTRTSASRPRSTAPSVTSPMPVGGRISGVDESITVHVQQLHSNGLLGQVCCIPGGGTDSPWAGTTTFANRPTRSSSSSASTGGHVSRRRAVHRHRREAEHELTGTRLRSERLDGRRAPWRRHTVRTRSRR